MNKFQSYDKQAMSFSSGGQFPYKNSPFLVGKGMCTVTSYCVGNMRITKLILSPNIKDLFFGVRCFIFYGLDFPLTSFKVSQYFKKINKI